MTSYRESSSSINDFSETNRLKQNQAQRKNSPNTSSINQYSSINDDYPIRASPLAHNANYGTTMNTQAQMNTENKKTEELDKLT